MCFKDYRCKFRYYQCTFKEYSLRRIPTSYYQPLRWSCQCPFSSVFLAKYFWPPCENLGPWTLIDCFQIDRNKTKNADIFYPSKFRAPRPRCGRASDESSVTRERRTSSLQDPKTYYFQKYFYYVVQRHVQTVSKRNYPEIFSYPQLARQIRRKH